MMTNGPARRPSAKSCSINLERPRKRVELAEDRHYVQYRKAVIDFLYTRQRPRRESRLTACAHHCTGKLQVKTFIRVIEYWVPSEDRSLLEFGGGLFGPATRFRGRHATNICFGRGEGLPGPSLGNRAPYCAQGP